MATDLRVSKKKRLQLPSNSSTPETKKGIEGESSDKPTPTSLPLTSVASIPTTEKEGTASDSVHGPGGSRVVKVTKMKIPVPNTRNLRSRAVKKV
ncbi:hypothetical protein BN14_12095 [Rhizoctonia solani AG-1 IB]|uniref:Uncharacterized protein n=1 Tax=Thanatephorus cucumeris (strain AG1-IB / isolate 7/3/14) TaxID=1108050 RepID=M5CF71_THACB|nr:hypothetical protein BN14_12095 [Rhizoctonia solani AG-1 IB]